MDKFRQEAEKYIELLYTHHKQSDIDAFKGLINLIFDYIDYTIKRKLNDKTED